MGLNQIGKLDRYVDIVEFVNSKDEFNSNTRAQQTVKSVWAQVQFRSSAEDHEEKVYSINKRDYIIHFDPEIGLKKMQDLAVIDEGKTYYVTGANSNHDGRGMYILLNCKLDG